MRIRSTSAVAAVFFGVTLPLPVFPQPSEITAPETLVEVKSGGIAFDNSGRRIPRWSGGALIVVDDSNDALPVIYSFRADGSEPSQLQFAIPESNALRATSIARAADGSMAVAGSAITADSRGALYLSRVSADGKQQQVIRLDSFYPFQVTIAADGTLWVAGEGDGSDYNVIRRFDLSRGATGAYVPSSSLKPDPERLAPAEDSVLVSSEDRIGWYSNRTRQYIELSMDGRELARLPGLDLKDPSRVDGIGLCDSGDVFVSVFPLSQTERRSEIFHLDRSNGGWRLVKRAGNSDVSRYSPVYGCDGNELVTRAKVPGQLLGLTWWRAAE